MKCLADVFNRSTTSTITRTKPFLLEQRSSVWFVTGTIGLGIFTDSFLYSVIVPILPYSLHTRSEVPQDSVQFWTSVMIAAYGGALLLASPIIGWIADSTSTRRRPYICSLLMLAGATTMLCFGRSVIVLVLARVLQGISAATVWVVGLSLLVDTAGSEHIGRAMGFAAMGSSCAILMGPLLGGLIYEQAGYNAVFYICFLLIVVDLFMRLALIEKRVAVQWTNSTNDETNDVEEAEQAIPLKPLPALKRIQGILSLLKSPRLLTAIFATTTSAILISSFDAVIPLHVKLIFDWTSTGAGLIFAAVIIPNFISPLTGWASDRYGPRWIVSTGYILFCPFLICLRSVTSNNLEHIILFCGLLAGLGFCYSMVTVPILSEFTHVVNEKEASCSGIFGTKGVYAQAYGLYNIAFSAGILIGPFGSGFLVQRFGWAVMTSCLALMCGITAVVTALWCGGGGRRVEVVSDTQIKGDSVV